MPSLVWSRIPSKFTDDSCCTDPVLQPIPPIAGQRYYKRNICSLALSWSKPSAASLQHTLVTLILTLIRAPKIASADTSPRAVVAAARSHTCSPLERAYRGNEETEAESKISAVVLCIPVFMRRRVMIFEVMSAARDILRPPWHDFLIMLSHFSGSS